MKPQSYQVKFMVRWSKKNLFRLLLNVIPKETRMFLHISNQEFISICQMKETTKKSTKSFFEIFIISLCIENQH